MKRSFCLPFWIEFFTELDAMHYGTCLWHFWHFGQNNLFLEGSINNEHTIMKHSQYSHEIWKKRPEYNTEISFLTSKSGGVNGKTRMSISVPVWKVRVGRWMRGVWGAPPRERLPTHPVYVDEHVTHWGQATSPLSFSKKSLFPKTTLPVFSNPIPAHCLHRVLLFLSLFSGPV